MFRWVEFPVDELLQAPSESNGKPSKYAKVLKLLLTTNILTPLQDTERNFTAILIREGEAIHNSL
jgi:hypothetical protein